MISYDILTQNWIVTDRQMDRHFWPNIMHLCIAAHVYTLGL